MPTLHAVMYHYIRDLPNTPFPRIKGMLVEDFRRQVQWLAENFEMATVESVLDFLKGDYEPKRDLCILTFDDAFKDHVDNALPILAEHKVQGVFGIITSSVEEQRVMPVHMNHFLAAALDFDQYKSEFIKMLNETTTAIRVDENEAQRSYPLDNREVAAFKFLVNFLVPVATRDRIIGELFEKHLGSGDAFARNLYMTWDEVRSLQNEGMSLAGHTHEHRPLSSLTAAELAQDLGRCRALLDQHALPQILWPFSYPYGKTNSYSCAVIERLQDTGFHCSFDTESGGNGRGANLFALHRTDCNGAEAQLAKARAFSQGSPS